MSINSVDDARRTLADLEAKLAAAAAREIELATEGRRLAFDAATGDAAAKKALAKFDEEAFVLDRNRKNLGHAIEEAKRRLAEAEREGHLLEEKTKAERALKIAESIEQRGRRLDEALLALAKEAEGLEDDFSELNYELGWRYPALANFKAMVERPFFTSLMFQPSGRTLQNGQPAPGTLKLRHLAPVDRATFSDLTLGYSASIRRTAEKVLGIPSEAA